MVFLHYLSHKSSPRGEDQTRRSLHRHTTSTMLRLSILTEIGFVSFAACVSVSFAPTRLNSRLHDRVHNLLEILLISSLDGITKCIRLAFIAGRYKIGTFSRDVYAREKYPNNTITPTDDRPGYENNTTRHVVPVNRSGRHSCVAATAVNPSTFYDRSEIFVEPAVSRLVISGLGSRSNYAGARGITVCGGMAVGVDEKKRAHHYPIFTTEARVSPITPGSGGRVISDRGGRARGRRGLSHGRGDTTLCPGPDLL